MSTRSGAVTSPVTCPAMLTLCPAMSACTTLAGPTDTASEDVSLPRTLPCTTISSSLVISPSMLSPSPMTVPAMLLLVLYFEVSAALGGRGGRQRAELQIEIRSQPSGDARPGLDGNFRAP